MRISWKIAVRCIKGVTLLVNLLIGLRGQARRRQQDIAKYYTECQPDLPFCYSDPTEPNLWMCNENPGREHTEQHREFKENRDLQTVLKYQLIIPEVNTTLTTQS